jgi:deoxyxylulose-5-phosphate synthase
VKPHRKRRKKGRGFSVQLFNNTFLDKVVDVAFSEQDTATYAGILDAFGFHQVKDCGSADGQIFL